MSNLGDALENEIRKEIFGESYEEIRTKVKREVEKNFLLICTKMAIP